MEAKKAKKANASDTVQVDANQKDKKRSVSANPKQPFFQNSYTFQFDPKTMTEKFTKPSNTVPGMVEEMKEMFERFRMGQIVPTRNYEYGEDFGEEVNPMYKPGLDLTDIDNVRQYILELEEKVKTKNLKEEKEKTEELSPPPLKEEKQEETKTS